MNRFQRGIVNGLAIMSTISAVTLEVLFDLELPTWVWMTWIPLVGIWIVYDYLANEKDTRRIRANIDRAIAALLQARQLADMEENFIGGEVLFTHQRSACEGENCCIHDPSDHHMRQWPQKWRADRLLMERICDHGIGHPDPDDVDYHQRSGRRDVSIHSCDGCCVEVAA